MKKIPSIFQRDWEHNPDALLPIPMPECDWVFRNEGIATRKWDGTACMVKDLVLYKRYDAKKGKPIPPGGISCQEPDPITGHHPYWVPVDFNKPENWMHQEGWFNAGNKDQPIQDGTYELCGPNINGNPENLIEHVLIRHGEEKVNFKFTTNDPWNEIQTFLRTIDIEGIVFHHPDGRMAKIKKRDFGIPRK